MFLINFACIIIFLASQLDPIIDCMTVVSAAEGAEVNFSGCLCVILEGRLEETPPGASGGWFSPRATAATARGG